MPPLIKCPVSLGNCAGKLRFACSLRSSSARSRTRRSGLAGKLWPLRNNPRHDVRDLLVCHRSSRKLPRQSVAPTFGTPTITVVRSPWSLTRARYDGSTIEPALLLPLPPGPWHEAQKVGKLRPRAPRRQERRAGTPADSRQPARLASPIGLDSPAPGRRSADPLACLQHCVQTPASVCRARRWS